jgi:hypothetical protein
MFKNTFLMKKVFPMGQALAMTGLVFLFGMLDYFL